MDLSVDVKKNLNRSCDVIISSIIPRGDQLQQKAFNVNKELKELCASKNIRYTEHGNIHPRNHLNRSKLHFNFQLALLTGLSKAFDCLLHDLLIAKLHAYVFEIDSVRLIYSYLVGRKQQVKIDNEYSTWQEILFGVPQGSILGPLLFKIHMCDLFFVVESVDIASYADDATPYVCLEDIDLIIEKLDVKANENFQ